jgi:hypothetical protein
MHFHTPYKHAHHLYTTTQTRTQVVGCIFWQAAYIGISEPYRKGTQVLLRDAGTFVEYSSKMCISSLSLHFPPVAAL